MKTVRVLALIEATTITGPAKNLLQFAQMARAGACDPPIEVTVITMRRLGSGPNLFVKAAKEAGAGSVEIPERGPYDRQAIAEVGSLMQRFEADVIQSHASKSHFLARMAEARRFAPWIAFHHGYTWPDWRARFYNQFDRWSLRQADLAVTVSSPFRQEMEARGVRRDRIEIVQNAIDPDWGRRDGTDSTALRQTLGIPVGKKVILIVGRLSNEKDHITLLHALHELVTFKSHESKHLLIVGEGPSRIEIERTIRRLDLSAHVTLTGQVPSAEPYYRIADIAVLSSLSEGSPNALLEAMAARVPAVATAVGGIPEMVRDGESALLIQPRNPGAMAQALRQLLENPDIAAGIADRARETVLLNHSPEARLRRLSQIYKRVIDARKASSGRHA